jgi:hypothetical protein
LVSSCFSLLRRLFPVFQQMRRLPA